MYHVGLTDTPAFHSLCVIFGWGGEGLEKLLLARRQKCV